MKKCIKFFYKIFSILYFLISLLTTNSCHPQLNPKVETQNKWTKLMGVNSASTTAYGIDDDSKGYIYLSGYTDGPLDGQILNGTRDLLLIKFAPDGEKIWTKLFGAFGAQTYNMFIDIDLYENIYVTGYTNGNLDGQIKTGNIDLFLIKFNSSGEKLFTKLFGAPSGEVNPIYLKIDKENNILISGKTDSNLDGIYKNGLWDTFLIKYSSNGIKKWTKLLGATGASTFPQSMKILSKNNIFIIGCTNGNLDGQIKSGTLDLFITNILSE